MSNRGRGSRNRGRGRSGRGENSSNRSKPMSLSDRFAQIQPLAGTTIRQAVVAQQAKNTRFARAMGRRTGTVVKPQKVTVKSVMNNARIRGGGGAKRGGRGLARRGRVLSVRSGVRDRARNGTATTGGASRGRGRGASLRGGRGGRGGGRDGGKSKKPSVENLDMDMADYWHKAGKGPDPKEVKLDQQMDDYWSSKPTPTQKKDDAVEMVA